MQKITTHLWFDDQAKEAAKFYVSVFSQAGETGASVLHDTPSGNVDVVTIQIYGQAFTLISAGPLFKFNPSVSFLVGCETKEEVDALWKKLVEGGSPLMELGSYPHSERYGWVQDKYGISWQVMLMGDMKVTQKITPTMMFVGDVCGKAEDAVKFYTSVFHDARIDHILRYEKNEIPDKEGTVKHTGFVLEGQAFAAMDSARMHGFSFNEAISFVVHCADQAEIDYYWEKLSADPKAEQCGWLKDKYGFSWQIVPTIMEEMMSGGNAQQMARVTQAFLKMKKFDIEALTKAYEGK